MYMSRPSIVRPMHTHIRVSHAWKPPEMNFQTKVFFDVLLTPEVTEGHITPLEVVSDRHTRMFVFPVSENHEKRISKQN